MMLEIPEERGEEERRGARTPCTVTAPARIAGHRLPVWANKIGRVFALLCELKEDRESVKVGGGLGLYGEYGGPSVWGRARRSRAAGWFAGARGVGVWNRGWWKDQVVGAGVLACGVRCCTIDAKSLRREEGGPRPPTALRTAARLESHFFSQEGKVLPVFPRHTQCTLLSSFTSPTQATDVFVDYAVLCSGVQIGSA
jgi:hypothetical protein